MLLSTNQWNVKAHLSVSISHFHCHPSNGWWITVAAKLDSLESHFFPIGLSLRSHSDGLMCGTPPREGNLQIGTNTTQAKHGVIGNERIRWPASSAPSGWVPCDCQIPLHAIYIIIQSAVYWTRMGGSLFVVLRLVLSCTRVKRRLLLHSMSEGIAWRVLLECVTVHSFWWFKKMARGSDATHICHIGK